MLANQGITLTRLVGLPGVPAGVSAHVKGMKFSCSKQYATLPGDLGATTIYRFLSHSSHVLSAVRWEGLCWDPKNLPHFF
jgi:hypothetical protein